MRGRGLLILFLVVVGLAAFIWFFERDLPSTEDRLEQARLVLPLATDEVDSVVLEVGDQNVELVRRGSQEEMEAGGGWALVEPLEAAADRDAVEQLLSTVAELEKVRTLGDVEAAEVGLDPPRGTLRVTMGSPLGELCAAVAKRLREKAAFLSDQARSPEMAARVPQLLATHSRLRYGALALGKWHLAARDNFGHPLRAGFERFAGSLFNISLTLEQDHGGFPGVNGWLVDPRDGGDLVGALLEALAHPDLAALGRAARARAALFPPARMADGMRRAILHAASR